MSKRNPEEISASVSPATPDQPAGQPTGNESTKKAPRPDMPAHTTSAKAAQLEGDALEQAQSIAAEYYEKLADLTADFADQAREYATQSRQFASDHPGSSVAGGFALGVLVGVLLGRN